MTTYNIFNRIRIIIGLIALVTVFAIPSPNLADYSDVNVVPTFHSLGLYWSPLGASADRTVSVQYRPANYNTWFEGYPMWYSERADEYRSSLVHLLPNTQYEIKMTVDETGETTTVYATTWNEQFPIARVIELPELSTEMLSIEESGTPDGYILYTAQPGQSATIDVQNNETANIYLDASYVIIRGLTLKNATDHGILVGENAHDIVIEDNDISGYGRFAYEGTHFGYGDAAGIFSTTSSDNVRFIIQRNRIHHPRADANSWGETRDDKSEGSYGTHPGGPAGIYLFNSGGNHVIRYNAIYSSDDHQFNDCIGGGANFSDMGSPNRDSDIYGNYISHCWDNAIEAEGGNRNVRIWGNYMTMTYHAIANRETNLGPLYIWRNVFNASRRYPRELYHWDDDPRGSFQKAGGDSDGDNGVFVFHNTMLQLSAPDMETTIGGARGSAGPMSDTTTRNNIFHVVCDSCYSIDVSDGASSNDFDYDLYNGRIDDPADGEANGFYGTPIYTSLHGFALNTYQGIFTLAPESLGYDQALPLPNFSEGYITGNGPDVGAHEAGMPPMTFGPRAYLNGEPYGYVHTSTGDPTLIATPTMEPSPTETTTEPSPTETTPMEPSPTPTSRVMPTSTVMPTNTVMPTSTMMPTNTPMPTNTVMPTNTPMPTNTAMPPSPMPTNTMMPTNTPQPPISVQSVNTVSGIYVTNLEGWSPAHPSANWDAYVEVSVKDTAGLPVANAHVSGTWSVNGDIGACITDMAGQCTVILQRINRNQDGTMTNFTITNIVHPSYQYLPVRNIDIDGDSTGTSIAVQEDL